MELISQLHDPAALPTENKIGMHWTGGCVGSSEGSFVAKQTIVQRLFLAWNSSYRFFH